MQRFAQAYKVERGADLGDPEFWNRRFQDIDLRVAARESDAEKLDRAAGILLEVGLARLNDTFTPLILEARSQLANFGVLFTATSDSEVTIGLGEQTFVLSEDSGPAFVFTDYAYAHATEDDTAGVVGRVVSYDKNTRLLTLDVVLVDGSGMFDSWTIGPSVKPDTAHATRIDNPHQTTAAQVGAYTTGEVDAFISGLNTALGLLAPKNSPTFTGTPGGPTPPSNENSGRFATTAWSVNYVSARIAEIVGAAPGSLDTLGELAAALNANPAQINDILTALNNRLRFDAADVLDTTERTRLFDNLSLAAVIKSLLVATDQAGARAAIGAQVAGNYQPAGNYQVAGNYQTALGYTPLNPANNLSELPNKDASRTNLQLGSGSDVNFRTVNVGFGFIYFANDQSRFFGYDGNLDRFGASKSFHSAGNLSCDGSKLFEIPHPLDETRLLRHAAIEGPEAAVRYRNEGTLIGASVEIELPDYFTALADEKTATVQITPIATDQGACGLAASRVANGRFKVIRTGTPTEHDQPFCWSVEATRRDIPPLEVEPLKAA